MKHDKTIHKNFLLHEIFSKAAAGVVFFYTYCMHTESQLMTKDEKKNQNKIEHFEEQSFDINGNFAR